MRLFLVIGSTCGWLLLLAWYAAGNETVSAKSIADKAVKAHGGATILAKYKGYARRTKAKLYSQDGMISSTSDEKVLSPDYSRVELKMTAKNGTTAVLSVQNRTGAWLRTGGMTSQLPADDFAELREDLYADWVTTFLPFDDKQLQTEPLDEIKVNDQPAVGLKVTHSNHREIRLYFNAKTGLLAESERRRRDPQTNRDIEQKTYFRDHKDLQGIKYAMREKTYRDGKLSVEAETISLKWMEKFEERLFMKP